MEGTGAQGDSYLYKTGVDAVRTFQKLFDTSYLPFTFAEFQGTHPIEDTVCTFSHTGDTVTEQELFAATVTCNYGISDVYAIVKNAAGEEIYRHAVRAQMANVRVLPFVKEDINVFTWGKLDLTQGACTVEVEAQLATGERPVIYRGKLIP